VLEEEGRGPREGVAVWFEEEEREREREIFFFWHQQHKNERMILFWLCPLSM